MQQVLYISYDGMTDPLGQSQVLPYLCGLSRLGYRITLLSCEKPERYNKFRTTIENICTQAGINWQPIGYTATPPVISTIKDIRNLHKRAYALHKQHNYSIVHCRSYISAMVGLNMQKRFGTKFLFDMRGFWADERVDGGLWNLKNPVYNAVYKYFKKKEKQYLQQADHIISLTYAGSDELNQWPLHRKLPITVIPCCVDTTLFDPATIIPAQQQQLRNQLNIQPQKNVVGYVGSIGTWYLLNEMLACFRIIRKQDAHAVMLFVTTEPASMVHAACDRLGIDKDTVIVHPAARQEVPLYISIMRYGLFFIKPCFSKKASSPTKQGEIMAMGIPVICNANVGDTAYVVSKYHSGIALEELNETTYQRAIYTINDTTYYAAEIRAGAIDFYGLNKGIALYAGVYQQLTAKK